MESHVRFLILKFALAVASIFAIAGLWNLKSNDDFSVRKIQEKIISQIAAEKNTLPERVASLALRCDFLTQSSNRNSQSLVSVSARPRGADFTVKIQQNELQTHSIPDKIQRFTKKDSMLNLCYNKVWWDVVVDAQTQNSLSPLDSFFSAAPNEIPSFLNALASFEGDRINYGC